MCCLASLRCRRILCTLRGHDEASFSSHRIPEAYHASGFALNDRSCSKFLINLVRTELCRGLSPQTLIPGFAHHQVQSQSFRKSLKMKPWSTLLPPDPPHISFDGFPVGGDFSQDYLLHSLLLLFLQGTPATRVPYPTHLHAMDRFCA